MDKFKAGMLILLSALVCVLALSRYAPRKAEVFKLTPLQTTSEGLCQEFKNSKEAIEKYSGKFVEISGAADHLGQTATGLPLAVLRGGDALGEVQCIFSPQNRDQARQIKPGTTVTLRGVCMGKVINLIVDECSLWPLPY